MRDDDEIGHRSEDFFSNCIHDIFFLGNIPDTCHFWKRNDCFFEISDFYLKKKLKVRHTYSRAVLVHL